jgi:NADH:ubiquinone oxidoreductase subunit F (NADH-binding)/NADH:ubiquinone oxidoreductase subunit E
VTSRNLVELVDRHRDAAEPTVLERLADTVATSGELTPDDIRRVAADTKIPEAAVYGVATYYDDLRGVRGERHVRVCTGTACYASVGEQHVADLTGGLGLALGERTGDGTLSLAETVCLGFCHSAPAVRDGDVVDAGPGVVGRVLAGTARPAGEPAMRAATPNPAIVGAPAWAGLDRALGRTPEQLIDELLRSGLTGRGGAAFLTGRKWRFAREAPGPDKVIVCNGDEGDPGSYIDKLLMEQQPELLLEGVALAGYAVGAAHGYVLVRSEYPRSKPALEAAAARARAAGWLGADINGTGFAFDVTIVEGAGSYVVGEETALLNSVQGLRGTVQARPPFPAQRGLYGLPTVVNNVETLCAAAAVAAGRDAQATKLVCFNESFVSPGVVEVPFGLTVRELCEDVAGGLRDGHAIKAVQIGGPLGGILPAALLDTPFTLEDLPAAGCMVGHGSFVAFDERTDIRDLCRHLLRFGAHESCGKCFPCRIGLHRAHEMAAAAAPIDQVKLEALLEALELGSLCAHGGGMPAPIRSLISHFPDELGLV